MSYHQKRDFSYHLIIGKLSEFVVTVSLPQKQRGKRQPLLL